MYFSVKRYVHCTEWGLVCGRGGGGGQIRPYCTLSAGARANCPRVVLVVLESNMCSRTGWQHGPMHIRPNHSWPGPEPCILMLQLCVAKYQLSPQARWSISICKWTTPSDAKSIGAIVVRRPNIIIEMMMQCSRCVVQGWQHDFLCIINLPHFQWNPQVLVCWSHLVCVEKGARQNSPKLLMKVSPVSIRKVKFACTYIYRWIFSRWIFFLEVVTFFVTLRADLGDYFKCKT